MEQLVNICGKRGNLHATVPAAAGAPGTAWRLCSACAGDYEDPDRTAFPLPEEEETVGTDPPQDED